MLYGELYESHKMTERKKLQKPPLVEALLEIKWELQEIAPGVFRDPGFNVAHLRFYERVKTEFAFIEPLPTLQVPDELTAHVTKYRYRVAEGRWPLVQIGPGIAALNFTDPYDWETFLHHARKLIPDLLAAYEGYTLTFSSIMLRYINAEPFDYEENDLLLFMKERLNTEFKPPTSAESRFSKGQITGANWSIQYELIKPEGTGILRFSTGLSPSGNKSVVWEQIVQSTGTQVPQSDGKENTEIIRWLELAHDVSEQWFLGVVAGKLLEQYEGG
jgi:uncharacterized protein (TIGR04255 family)